MLTVKIDPRLHARVKALAADLGVSTSEVVRDALKQRLAQPKRRRPQSVYQTTRDLCGVAETSDPGLSARRMSTRIRQRPGRTRLRSTELVERAAQGKEVTITRRGKAVAKLVPVRSPAAAERARAFDELAAFAKTAKVRRFNLRRAIERGRR